MIGGDCLDFNALYPNCFVELPYTIGDGLCFNSPPYNTEECGYDGEIFYDFFLSLFFLAQHLLNLNPEGGDCLELMDNDPGCIVNVFHKIGNGYCDFGEYNTAACQYDGGDCDDFNSKYPDCLGILNSELGDGICQHNTQGCNFDDGDCDAFRLFFPDCTADKPYLVGNGMCDEVYNTIECRNDGGDCIFTDATSGLFLNGEFISIEDYKADTKTYAIIQSLSSVISLVASLGIVFILYRSYNQMSVPFHRLLLGLSVADICSSFAQAWSTLLSPDPLDVIWNAHGSKGLCQAQGFLIFVGSIGAPLYNCSLCIYYLLAVKRKGIPSTDFLKKKEVLLHLVPIGLSLVGGLIIFCMDAFHPNMTYCFIGDNPVCDEEADCEKRLLYARILFVVFSAGPYIVLPCVIIGTMTLMYRELLALEKRLEQLLDVEGSTLRNRASNQREDSVPSGVDMNVSPTAVEGEVDVAMDKPSPPSSMLGKIGALM